MSKMYEMTIIVDTNDADYVTEVSKISSEGLEHIKPLITAIKNFKPYVVNLKGNKWRHNHNYPTGECWKEYLGEKTPEAIYDFNETIFEIFKDYLPSAEHGFHTIMKISVCPLVEKERLL